MAELTGSSKLAAKTKPCVPPCEEVKLLRLDLRELTTQLQVGFLRITSLEGVIKPEDMVLFQANQHRMLQLMDGDDKLGVLGLRKQLENIQTEVENLTIQRQKLQWMLVGVGMGSGLLGSGIGSFLLNLLSEALK